MASESTQMPAPSPIGYLLLRKIGREVPEDFNGCECQSSRCKNADCPCSKGEYKCTLKCECEDCDNMYGVRGNDSNTEPGQGGMDPFDLNRLPSSGIETEMAALSLATSVFRTGRLVPRNYEGCKCQTSRCYIEKCPCVQDLYRCTSKCECIGCDNMIGIIGGDSRTERGQGGTGGVSNVPDEAVQTTPSPNIESEQADDTSSMAGEPQQVEEQPTQSDDNGGFDLNKIPLSDNMFGVRGSDLNTEPGQGGTGGVSNVPDEAVQTTPSPIIESEQADDTSSMAGEPQQVEEQATQSEDNGGFDLNKIPPRR